MFSADENMKILAFLHWRDFASERSVKLSRHSTMCRSESRLGLEMKLDSIAHNSNLNQTVGGNIKLIL